MKQVTCSLVFLMCIPLTMLLKPCTELIPLARCLRSCICPSALGAPTLQEAFLLLSWPCPRPMTQPLQGPRPASLLPIVRPNRLPHFGCLPKICISSMQLWIWLGFYFIAKNVFSSHDSLIWGLHVQRGAGAFSIKYIGLLYIRGIAGGVNLIYTIKRPLLYDFWPDRDRSRCRGASSLHQVGCGCSALHIAEALES